MSKFSFVSLFLLVLIVAPCFIEARRCVVGKGYFDGCNQCICGSNSEDGEANIACTLKLCYTVNESGETVEQQGDLPPPADFWED